MKHIWLILTLCISMYALPAEAKDDKSLDYTIQGAGTATQGDYLVKVTLISKKKKVSNAQLCSAAVHGVLFRGFSNQQTRQSQKPLAGSAANEAQHADFYKDFFAEGGNAKNYADVMESSRSVTKIDGKYHVTAIVTVHKENLLKYLEESGVVKGLNSIF